jgi:catechol 2,3-dioxygenase-like lactoylglutathione lyase family enzyme
LIKNRGMRHLALKLSEVERAKDFYVRVFGMKIVWQPEADNAYPSSECDNLALHRAKDCGGDAQRLDHLGFIVPTIAEVEAGYAWAKRVGVEIVHELKHHRDGPVSFYIHDPDGNLIQALYEPTISPQFDRRAIRPGETS